MKKLSRAALLSLGVLCCASSSIATGVAIEGVTRAPGVSMAIEWVPYARPSIRPLESRRSVEAIRLADEAIRAWDIRMEDRRLSMVLQRWCASAGWQLVWEAERDFGVDSAISLQGSFMGALEAVMGSLSDSDYPLQAILNPNTRVVRVRRQLEITR